MVIKEWALEDRPREKLYQLGSKKLTNAELIAIILSTGSRSLSALDLAKQVLKKADNDLETLSRLSVKQLCELKGIGPAKAVTIKAVMELANRKKNNTPSKLQKITSSQDAYEQFQGIFNDLKVEEFWVIFLNRANAVISKLNISKGGVSGTVVDPKVIFHHALANLATGIILAHNHPSGNLKPSRADIDITNKLVAAGRHLDIKVFDHLIVTNSNYYSFADNSLID